MSSKKAQKLSEYLESLPVPKWGIGNIDALHPLAEKYPKAISLVFPYKVDFDSYNEERFHDIIEKNKLLIKETNSRVTDFLDSEKIPYFIPEGKVDENQNSMFSYKLAAIRAGLGWIGKNSVFTMEEYGQRLHLSVILIDLDIECVEPLLESKCREECVECVKACPHKCIHNALWYPGIDRDLLFDAYKCKHSGHKKIDSQDRNFSCGLCVLSCKGGHQ